MHNLSYDKCINAAAVCNQIEIFLFFINKKTTQVTYLFVIRIHFYIIIDNEVKLIPTIDTLSKDRIRLFILNLNNSFNTLISIR